MKVKKLLITLCSLVLFIPLAGCGNSKADKWNYTKEETSNFYELTTIPEEKEGHQIFGVKTQNQLVTRNLKSDDVLFFNYTQAIEDFQAKETGDYLTYDDIKDNEIPFVEISTDENLLGFDIIHDSEVAIKDIAALVHKSVNKDDRYILLTADSSIYEEGEDDPQKEYEKKYASTKFDWQHGGKFTATIITNLGMILGGIAFDSPTTTLLSIFNILNSIGDIFGAKGPTAQDIMNKLKEMEKKLDEISAKIDKNHQQLMDETVRTQANVDKATLETLKSSITDFSTDYLVKIDDFNRDLSVVFQSYYKLYVAQPEEVSVYLYQNDKKEWCSRTLNECGKHETDEIIDVTISSFPNALKSLKDNGNIVSKGFMDALYTDIDEAIKGMTLKEGMSKETFRYMVSALISETFMKTYFSQNPNEAQKFANLMINASKRYSGRLGAESIATTYVNRFQYMFNFAKEVKPHVTTFVAKHLYNLDTNVAKAIQACEFAEINFDELKDEYKLARDFMNDVDINYSKQPDNYSFATGYKLDMQVFGTRYDHEFIGTGNHPDYKSEVKTYNIKSDGQWANIWKETDYSKLNVLQSTDHRRIATRMNLLQQLGYVGKDKDYADYFADVGVMDSNTKRVKECLVSGRSLTDENYHFVTSLQERGLNDNTDREKTLICEAKPNEKSYYFDIGKYYKYKGVHSGEYWKNSACLFSNCISGKNGAMQGNCDLTWKCIFWEDHWWWKNDEIFSFSYHTPGSLAYYFSLLIV